jgi:hypothetical protein
MNKKALGRQSHILAALGILYVIYLFIVDYVIIPKEWLVYIFPFVLGSIAPDLLEPATSMFHRSYFHSKRMLKILLFVGIPMFSIASYITSTKWIHVVAFLIGWSIHIGLDSLTTRGIPN